MLGDSVAGGASLQSGMVKPEVKQEVSASHPQENHAGAALDAEENRKLLEKREAELDAEKESNLKLHRCMLLLLVPQTIPCHTSAFATDWVLPHGCSLANFL